MSNRINIGQLEKYLMKAGLENGDLEEVLSPIKELNNQRRYGLVWEEPDSATYDTDSAEQELLKNFPFLNEVSEHRIFNGEKHPDHLLIEGDNLHALKTMQYTHKNKVDVIYIDPPYNTGNTDFVYNDKFVDGEDSWKHSKWLSFMNKRLRLARELMTDDGVIFISIDDNELYQLKLLCDQVFGEQNFVGTIIQDKGNAQNDAKSLQKNHEYILTYQKKDVLLVSVTEELVKVYEDEHGYWYRGSGLTTGGAGGTLNARPNLGYTIYYHEKTKNKIAIRDYDVNNARTLNDEEEIYSDREDLLAKGYNKIRPPKKGSLLGCWTWSIEKFNQNQKLIGINKTKTGYTVFQKKYVDYVEHDGSTIYSRKEKTLPSKSILKYSTSAGTRSLVDVLGRKVFNNPKNTEMIKYLIALHPNPNALVLDFFAGSGTTTHAVMELNKEDGGNRQSIVITNNEINSSEEENLLVEKGFVEPFTGSRRGTKKHAKWLDKVNAFKETSEYLEFIETDEYKDLGIARAVTEQRINKVINGYTTPKGKEVDGLSENNFYHFEVKLEPDLMDIDLNTYVLINKTKDIIRIKEGTYTSEDDISTDTVPSVKLSNNEKEVIVVLSVRIADTDIEQLVKNFESPDKEHVIYTSYSDYEYGINDIRFEELPKELLQAIKHNDDR